MASPELGVVIVTGGASGLGAATVAAVAEAGGTPVVLDRHEPPAGGEHEIVDLADPRASEAAVVRVAERHKSLSGIVTAAAFDVPGRLEDVEAATWDRIVAVNLVGTACVVRAALPFLERSSGTVVTVGSTLGFKAVGDATAYYASKFGVIGFTRALAAETAGRIGVTLLVPGGDENGVLRRARGALQAARRRHAEPARGRRAHRGLRADPAAGLRGARTRGHALGRVLLAALTAASPRRSA